MDATIATLSSHNINPLLLSPKFLTSPLLTIKPLSCFKLTHHLDTSLFYYDRNTDFLSILYNILLSGNKCCKSVDEKPGQSISDERIAKISALVEDGKKILHPLKHATSEWLHSKNDNTTCSELNEVSNQILLTRGHNVNTPNFTLVMIFYVPCAILTLTTTAIVAFIPGYRFLPNTFITLPAVTNAQTSDLFTFSPMHSFFPFELYSLNHTFVKAPKQRAKIIQDFMHAYFRNITRHFWCLHANAFKQREFHRLITRKKKNLKRNLLTLGNVLLTTLTILPHVRHISNTSSTQYIVKRLPSILYGTTLSALFNSNYLHSGYLLSFFDSSYLISSIDL
ncbi:hypothetical protein RCL_jg8416.t1 [Rhizophagus clarus]|uniref:Uncharacterized protein n=1 Tax=Rhizophagus clarus TaxID=94130 RepID=A0A8H3MEW4_9GLOM|nr:hypothetical protein RCL_jg8416.t1 [Rhizophagus clarus]